MASAGSNNNSFKKLGEIEENQAPHPSPQTEHNIMGTARNIGFIGNVIELYFSKALGMISALFGGTDITDEGSTDTQKLIDADGSFDNDNTIEPGGRAN